MAKKRTPKQIAAFKKMRAALERKRGKKKRRKKSGSKKRRKKNGGKKRRKKSGKRKPRKSSRPRASRRKVSGEKRSTISANEVLALARAGKLR